ncbi:MAG: hypothetical protein K6E70_01120 [Butyrivibrio sp.]|nr:hypothetical protein [Butyrivibrio sp.]
MMNNTSESLAEKLLNSEKVICKKCGKGNYIPYNNEVKVNHYFRCPICNDMVHLEANVEVK